VKISVLAAAVLFAAAGLGLSHGTDCSIGEGAKYIKTFYDDGSPMAFCKVTVFAPDESEFQSGITDRNGVFAFLPDAPGAWKIEVDDGMGHKMEKTILIDNAYELSEMPHGKASRGYGIITGIGLIFGISGLLFILRAGRGK